MGSIGASKSPAYDDNFKYWLDKNAGNERLAMEDYLSDNYFYETVEAPNGTEYKIIDDAGMQIKIVEPATPDHTYAIVNVTLYVQEGDKKPKWWTIKDRYNPIKAKEFEIPVYK